MSSMIQQPPTSITLPQPGGAGPAGGTGSDENASVTALLKKALDNINQAAILEKDDIDASAIHQLAAAVSKQIAAEQKLTDDVMGAGPGVKMVRKASGPQA